MASSYHGRVWRLVDPAGDVDPAPLVSHHPAVVRRDERDRVNLAEENEFKVMFYEHSLLPEPGRPSQDPRASLQGPLRPLKTEKYEKTLVKMYFDSVCYILQTI